MILFNELPPYSNESSFPYSFVSFLGSSNRFRNIER